MDRLGTILANPTEFSDARRRLFETRGIEGVKDNASAF